jgi:hypothetical protein
VEVPVTLEELAAGGAKAVTVSRAAAAAAEGEPTAAEARRLSVRIEPGAPDGTTFVFEG